MSLDSAPPAPVLAAQAAAHLRAANAQPATPLSPHAMRVAGRGYLDLQLPPPRVDLVRHSYIVGPGSSLPVRIYRSGPPGGPVILLLHGSGFVIADLEVCDEPARQLALDTGATVVAVDYRKAPENPYPAALDDAWATLMWIAGGELAVNTSAIAVVGDSAGGTLTASLVQKARDEGGPHIAAHAVLYPPLDQGAYATDIPADSVSLTAAQMDWFWQQYSPPLSAPALPLRAAHFTDLPPAFVAAAQCDVLRDDARRYAKALQAAGVEVRYIEYPGMIHGFFWMDAVLDCARELQIDLANWLKSILTETK